ncbi:bifunctional 3-(3-hydroxy-phenyl)propionate/3-hydroxycinnamic acid hydroxylase [Polymorphobacter arshaanensis]|uniref:Bifunctional 3-(3-hydroxy-phenyl)propionate/3-hydroxycinnamic acid hydroxylase n=1 Tax=Glacieibacterium arshaanense TaxID=2511025 RepID=A0A4Y9EQ04_9SPHN|nr:bifunctional 3-(3-hydroxy-phenyl)propionate/3-hydroxycinnamic acid hydroxylase [Polymorphobacter arshaanensis]TFU05686.1 bifunctional 3-(3-hydroxy-phenyl)propionate/3-hydroxycinnamic acid hydroxylase [Polymorphobacter arshaanensis]
MDTDVLIIGAGPTGVALGIALAQHGVSVILADKADGIYPLPRAAHIDHETMRILQALGVGDAVFAKSRPSSGYDFLTAKREVLLRFASDPVTSPSGWPMANMIHQPSVEAIMRDRLAALPNTQLRQGLAFAGFTQDADGVTASFEDGTTLRARYLVGADGASSAVRVAAGGGLDDLAFDEPWLVFDVIVHDESRLPDINLQICDPERPTTCVLMAPGRHRWEFMLKPGETPESINTPESIAALLKPWNVDGAVTPERSAVYRFHALVAKAWRTGRVLLAGDAAHQMPPFAGQGLCSGLRDAANLGWKLAGVINGDADAALLDTYQAEREPHVRAIIDMALMMGRTVCITDPAAAAARDAAMLAARAAEAGAGGGGGGGIGWPPFVAGCILAGSPGAGELFPQPWRGGQRLDDVLGAGPWLIARAPATDAIALDDGRLAPFHADLARWLDKRGADAVLVRADRTVFGTGVVDVLQGAWAMARGNTA